MSSRAAVLTRLREPAGARTADAPVCFTDPDCRFGYKAMDACFPGCKVHQALDPDSRLVLSVETVPGHANGAVEAGTLRRLVRRLRHARVELGACQARFRNTLLPACVQRLCPAAGEAPRRGAPPPGRSQR
jgi:hypothetical protein